MVKNLLTYILLILSFNLIISAIYGQGFTNIGQDEGLGFSFETIEYGGGVSFVDFNNDGYDDLSFATHKGELLKFFISDGEHLQALPSFVDDTSEVKQVLWVDYNNDGLLDLYISSESKNKLYENLGDLEFEEVTEASGLSADDLSSYCSTWLDYDKDGNLDLCVSQRTKEKAGRIDLYRNNGEGGFLKVTTRSGLVGFGESVLAMTTIDYNRDGWDDIYLAQDFEKGNVILENSGNGTFRDVSDSCGVAFKMNSMTATVMDFNSDGWEDIYVTNTTSGNVFLENNQDNTFSEISALYNLNIRNVTFGAIFFDVDNDMDLDVHLGGMLSNFTYENTGDNGPFVKRNNDWGLESDRDFNNGVAMGDYNGDGAIDFVKNSVERVGFISSSNSLWRNDFKGNNFVKINLKGTISNSFAIGSRLELYAGESVQYRKIGCGESFSSQHSYTQHFGIGENTIIDSLIVRWPSENTSILKNIGVNQTMIIEEPMGGCMDSEACNYNLKAIYDNSSCRYVTDFYDCTGCNNDSDGDGVCDELELSGCTDPLSCTYNPIATEDDGSCSYLPLTVIIGPANAPPLEEVSYVYSGEKDSKYEWVITNGSIVLGQGTSKVIVFWHEKEVGNLEVVEVSESECKGEKVSYEVEIMNSILLDEEEVISLLPNPAQLRLTIKGLSPVSDFEYKIYDLSGKTRSLGKVNKSNFSIEIQDLSAGLYVLELIGNNEFTRLLFSKI